MAQHTPGPITPKIALAEWRYVPGYDTALVNEDDADILGIIDTSRYPRLAHFIAKTVNHYTELCQALSETARQLDSALTEEENEEARDALAWASTLLATLEQREATSLCAHCHPCRCSCHPRKPHAVN